MDNISFERTDFGDGNVYPVGFSRILSGLEGFMGVFMMSYFTIAFVRKVLR